MTYISFREPFNTDSKPGLADSFHFNVFLTVFCLFFCLLCVSCGNNGLLAAVIREKQSGPIYVTFIFLLSAGGVLTKTINNTSYLFKGTEDIISAVL